MHSDGGAFDGLHLRYRRSGGRVQSLSIYCRRLSGPRESVCAPDSSIGICRKCRTGVVCRRCDQFGRKRSFTDPVTSMFCMRVVKGLLRVGRNLTQVAVQQYMHFHFFTAAVVGYSSDLNLEFIDHPGFGRVARDVWELRSVWFAIRDEIVFHKFFEILQATSAGRKLYIVMKQIVHAVCEKRIVPDFFHRPYLL